MLSELSKITEQPFKLRPIGYYIYVTPKKKSLPDHPFDWFLRTGRISCKYSGPQLCGEMGDTATLAVHRCRFVDFTPSAITAITFPPLPLPSVKDKKPAAGNQPLKFGTLAIGRANGNIELCEWTGGIRQAQAPQAWVVRKVNVLFIVQNVV